MEIRPQVESALWKANAILRQATRHAIAAFCLYMLLPLAGCSLLVGDYSAADGGSNDGDAGPIDDGKKNCDQDLACDDHNPCTIDSCEFDTCVHRPALVATTCDDGNICTLDDFCQAGVCMSGNRPNLCDDGNSCTLDSCNAAMQLCEHVQKTDANEGLNYPGTCSDGIDNDCDGLTDSQDLDCVDCSKEVLINVKEDTYLRGIDPDSNYSLDPAILASWQSDGTDYKTDQARILMRFDPQQIKQGLSSCVLDSAVLRMTLGHCQGDCVNGGSIKAFEVVADWKNSEVTWNSYKEASSDQMGAQMASFALAGPCSSQGNCNLDLLVELEIKELAGTWSESDNRGVMIRAPMNNPSVILFFVSSDATVETIKKPHLVLKRKRP